MFVLHEYHCIHIGRGVGRGHKYATVNLFYVTVHGNGKKLIYVGRRAFMLFSGFCLDDKYRWGRNSWYKSHIPKRWCVNHNLIAEINIETGETYWIDYNRKKVPLCSQ